MPTTLRDSSILIFDQRLESLVWLMRLLEWKGFRNVHGVASQDTLFERMSSHLPDLVILDPQLPRRSALETIRNVRSWARIEGFLPILVFSNARDARTRIRAFQAGATDFLTKPGDAAEILIRIKSALEARAMHRLLQQRNCELEQCVRSSLRDAEMTRLEALSKMARMTEFHDDGTGEHTARVGNLAAGIALEMGLGRDFAEMMRLAAPLHDVGKIGIAESILKKPGPLTPAEFQEIARHVQIGAEILGSSEVPAFRLAKQIALYHHERWDGTGYGAGLKEKEIPIEARIVAVADVYDALTHSRPYKAAWTPSRARREIVAQSGAQFDPEVVSAFLEVLRKLQQSQKTSRAFRPEILSAARPLPELVRASCYSN